MTKQEFLTALEERLNGVSENRKNEYLDYYQELLADKIEDGLTEEEAVGQLDVNAIADGIIKEVSLGIEDGVTYVENHSVIDCTNRYKMDNGKYNFMVKVPEGTKWEDVKVEVTQGFKGEHLFYTNLMVFSNSEEWKSSVAFRYNYAGSDYYELITNRLAPNGMGIRLYLKYQDHYYMATDTAIGSTTPGQSYWLGA